MPNETHSEPSNGKKKAKLKVKRRRRQQKTVDPMTQLNADVKAINREITKLERQLARVTGRRVQLLERALKRMR